MVTLSQHCPIRVVVWLPRTRLLREVPVVVLSRKLIEMAGRGKHEAMLSQLHCRLSFSQVYVQPLSISKLLLFIAFETISPYLITPIHQFQPYNHDYRPSSLRGTPGRSGLPENALSHTSAPPKSTIKDQTASKSLVEPSKHVSRLYTSITNHREDA